MDIDLEKIAEEIIEEAGEIDPNSLLSPEQQKAAQKQDLIAALEMKEHSACLDRAMTVIVEEGTQIMSRDEIQQLRDGIAAVAKASAEEADVSPDATCPQEALGLSDDCMGLFLRVAQDQYRSQHWENAADVFTLLTTLNPFIEDCWLGLGGACQHQKNWEDACHAYATAAFLNHERPLTRLLIADCCLQCDKQEMAKQQLQRGCELLNEGEWPESWQALADKLQIHMKKGGK